ncbi:MAG: gamma-glutamyl-gamma-aminobutyrate hydrolase family protein [Campylobacterales bacterium]|nr:gamma-glutamyl-gamma-aminobutyrate hydrolase family protein [Campylobacterales bacterium]
MKKIAITQRLTQNDTYFEEREMLDTAWGRLFEQIDFLPIVLPYECDFKNYFDSLEIDGILLSGGNDLNSLNPNELSQKRDAFELKIIKYAIENSIPLFGVCRGMQIIAKYFNASFEQVNNQVNIKHKLKVNEKSKYFDKLTKIKTVNSFHNYAIKDICDEFIISATNEKNMIKAIEHKKHKIFAQMWHSERVVPFDKNELNLIKEFFI